MAVTFDVETVAGLNESVVAQRLREDGYNELLSSKADEMGAESGYQRPLDLLGSGFIVAPTGVGLTNKHVIKGAARLVVQSADGKQFPIQKVSIDREYDAALLRIEAGR